MRVLIASFIFLFLSGNVFSQTFSLDPTFSNFSSGTNSQINATAIQDDGKILIGGFFNSYDGITRNKIARLNSDGSLDTTFNVGTGPVSRSGLPGTISLIVIDRNQKIIVAGNFLSFNGIPRRGIARLNSDGSVDTSFSVGALSNADDALNPPVIDHVVIDSADNIFISGRFSYRIGIPFRYGLAKVNNNGVLDTTFSNFTNANASEGTVLFTHILPDGKLLISKPGNPTRPIARLNSNGSYDTQFGTPFIAGLIRFIYPTEDGFLLGGLIRYLEDTEGGNILFKISSNGIVDEVFHRYQFYGSSAVNEVVSINIHNNKIYVAGKFSDFGGVSGLNNFARLNLDGTPDETFNIGTGFNPDVKSMSRQTDNKIVLAGSFSAFNTNPVNRICRLTENSLGIKPLLFDKAMIYNTADSFNVVSTGSEINSIKVFSVDGREVFASENYFSKKVSIPFFNDLRNVYVFRITFSNGNSDVVKAVR